MRLLLSVIVVFLSSLPACAAGPAKLAPAPAPAPSATPAAGDIHVASALKAIDANSLSAFATSIELELKQPLSDFRTLDGNRVTTLAAFREFGRYFGRIKQVGDEQKRILRWLAAQPRLMPVLMMAV